MQPLQGTVRCLLLLHGDHWLIEPVKEAAASRTAMIEAKAEALADTRDECSAQVKTNAAGIEAMQNAVKDSLRSSSQQQTVQSANVDAMGYRWTR